MAEKACIGVRREDKNPWEKRAPLIPSHVRELIEQQDLSVTVQPSEIRVFSDREYSREGAILSESLSGCGVILAIKEVPLELIQERSIYLFFTHTTKGQAYNRPMLQRLKDKNCTVIDYEKIRDEQDQRLLFFGIQAGQSGMIETLSALGNRLKHEGRENPFESLQQPHVYASLVDAREEIQKIGRRIHDQGLPSSVTPLVCGFMGYGRTSQGAQEMFDLLPHETLQPEDLETFFVEKNYSAHRVYKVVFKEEHLVEPLQAGAGFELQDYYTHPAKYRSVFSTYLPYLTILVNCIYWEPRFPRFVPLSALHALISQNDNPSLRVIGDISCDIEGSIECTRRITTPESPVFVYDPIKDTIRDGFAGRGVVIMAIDNLPAEIPLESSVFFSAALKPYIPAIAEADYKLEFSDCQLPAAIKRAVILYNGNFTPDYAYMQEYLT